MDLIIHEEKIIAQKQYIINQCETLSSISSSYISILKKIIDGGIIDGTTSDALKEFIVQVESKLTSNSSTPELMQDEVSRYCTNYLDQINRADKDLY